MLKEDRYAQLQDKFNALTEDEKDFITWCTTERLMEQYESEIIKSKKKKDIFYEMYLSDALRELKRISGTLAYKVF